MISIVDRIRASIKRENLRRIDKYNTGVRPAGLPDHERNKYLAHRLPADVGEWHEGSAAAQVRRIMTGARS